MTPHFHTHCIHCSSAEFYPLGKQYAHAYLVKCAACNLVFGSRIPSQEELAQHYAGYPRGTKISPLTIRRYEDLLEQFEPYRRTGRILDVGCGDGHFLAVAASKGWKVYGTEFTDEAVAICTAKGIQMHKGLIQEWTGEGDFDVITSFEVLEHITDGNEHAAKINSLLRKGGLFYLTTPNFNSLSRRWLGGKWKIIEYPEHLCYYTPATIYDLLTRAGFKRLEILTTGITLRQFPDAQSNYAHDEEQLRNSIEGSRILRFAKHTINRVLSWFELGDSLKGYFVKG